MSALVAVLLTGITVLAWPTPALAQVPPGSQATPLVGSGIVANCPAGSPATLASGTPSSNGVTVGFPAAGRCTPLAADAEGSYSFTGVGPLPFTSECANTSGVVTTHGGVTVPAGSTVNGGAPLASATVVETVGAAIVFPGGRTAIVNQVITTPTAVTRNAIVFTGGPTVGQVICGTAAYPLAVGVAGASGAPDVALPSAASADDSGPATGMLLLAAGVALAVIAAQVAVTRRLRGRPTS